MSLTARPRNALKHGDYANLGVLHQRVVGEFKPSGPTEHDVVLSPAKRLRRKPRLQIEAA
jgi:hypothetical protein